MAWKHRLDGVRRVRKFGRTR